MPASPTAAAPAPSRAQLIHIEVDRRLGHEWDEWDGRPLPRGGDFSAPPGLFFRFAALTLGLGMAAGAAVLFLLAPRLGSVWLLLPRALWPALGAVAAASWLWFGVLILSFYGGAVWLPERSLERGPYLALMNLTSQAARPCGRRDWAEHAAIDVDNAHVAPRGRSGGKAG